jgi:hypothetical protein
MADKRLQSARLVVFNNPTEYKKLLSTVQGKVDPGQCASLLTNKDTMFLVPDEVSALAASPCLNSDGDVDFRVLPDMLTPVDLRAEMQRYAEAQARLSLVSHLDKFWDACAAADKAKKGTLTLEQFDKVIKACAVVPHSMLVPHMVVQAGAMREAVVDYNAFGNHAAVVHESEMAVMRRGRLDEVCMHVCVYIYICIYIYIYIYIYI